MSQSILVQLVFTGPIEMSVECRSSLDRVSFEMLITIWVESTDQYLTLDGSSTLDQWKASAMFLL